MSHLGRMLSTLKKSTANLLSYLISPGIRMPDVERVKLMVSKEFSYSWYPWSIVHVFIFVVLVSNIVSCKVLYKSFFASFWTEGWIIPQTTFWASAIWNCSFWWSPISLKQVSKVVTVLKGYRYILLFLLQSPAACKLWILRSLDVFQCSLWVQS